MANAWITSSDFDGDGDLAIALSEVWPDGPLVNPVSRAWYLAAGKSAVIAYAPALAEGADLPDEYVLAQVMHARGVFNAGGAAPGGADPSAGEYGIAAYPLDWHVKQLLRPQRATGAVW